MKLVSYEEPGRYHLNESTLHALETLQPPVRVLAAVGDARIGKSSFLNMIHLHWDQTFLYSGATPFEVGSTTLACTHGVWVHVRQLPGGGNLVLVDVEGDNLGNDAVTEQLSALTAVLSSYILLFVRQMVNNAALEFLYHTTELGKMFPESDGFPQLGVAIRDALDLNPAFPDRQSEVVHSITSPTHGDGNDDMRREIGAVFPPSRITAFEVQYQDRHQLQELQVVSNGPYYESVQQIISDLKISVPEKLTPSRMKMCGGDLVEMIRRLFAALENGDIAVLETAFERLEKQMCDRHYFEWISPLLNIAEDEFMSKAEYHFGEFTQLCKVESYMERVRQELDTKRDGILREREERRKAEEAQKKAEEEKRKAEEALKEQRRQEALKREAELALIREEEARKRVEEQAAEEKRRLEERVRKEEAERRRAQEAHQRAEQELARRRHRKRRRGCVIL